MPAKLLMELQTDKDTLRYHSAALLHGALMELLSPEFADKMHIIGLRPYSQSIRTVRDRLTWKICTLDKEAEEEIISFLLKDEIEELKLKHNDINIKIVSKSLWKESYRDLIEKYYFSDCDRIVKIQLATPCSFKKDGRYVYIPDMRLIYQSLMKRFDTFSADDAIWMEEALEDLTNYTSIIGYNVRSTYFSLEGVRIPAFQGTLTLKLYGPQQLVNLAHLLFRYGEYSGVGIKTAMGMGELAVISLKGEGRHDR